MSGDVVVAVEERMGTNTRLELVSPVEMPIDDAVVDEDLIDFPLIAVYRHTCSNDDEQRPDFGDGDYLQRRSGSWNYLVGKVIVGDDAVNVAADASVLLAVYRQ